MAPQKPFAVPALPFLISKLLARLDYLEARSCSHSLKMETKTLLRKYSRAPEDSQGGGEAGAGPRIGRTSWELWRAIRFSTRRHNNIRAIIIVDILCQTFYTRDSSKPYNHSGKLIWIFPLYRQWSLNLIEKWLAQVHPNENGRDFSGNPVVKMSPSSTRGSGFNPWLRG